MNSGKNNHRRENFDNLPDEIRETERQLLDRQHRIHVHTGTLVRDLRKELASPAALLLAGELGFIIGELTKKPAKKEEFSADRKAATKDTGGASFSAVISPLKTVLGLQNLTPELYQALPLGLVWLMDTFHPENAPKKGSASASVKTQENFR
jgi:hypothetical protein